VRALSKERAIAPKKRIGSKRGKELGKSAEHNEKRKNTLFKEWSWVAGLYK
jgi:hypothetical protein